jgi:exosortase
MLTRISSTGAGTATTLTKTPSLLFNGRDTATTLVGSLSVAFLAWPVLLSWFKQYELPDSYYAHAPAIPVLIGLMLWKKREALKSVQFRPTYGMLAILAPSLLLLVFATREGTGTLESIALLFVVWSSVWFICGTECVKVAVFPLAFLASMAPLPSIILTDGTHHLQTISTDGAMLLLNAMSFHAGHVGNVIRMSHYAMAIDEPCSGFKMLLSMTAFGGAFAFLIDGPVWKRMLIFLSSVPLSLAVNSIRIAWIGGVGQLMGTSAAHTFHDWSGILTLWIAPAAFLLLARGLGCRTLAGLRLY